jgi:Transposase DDE domain/Transposase domain (DUF772)
MRILVTQPLFPWEELDDSPSLGAIKQLLELIPDRQLLDALQRRRHNGNNTYPVRVCWGALLLSIFLRHTTMRACLEELKRNLGLRLLIGIESEQQVPHDWNMTRFLDVLGQEPYLGLLRDVFNQLIRRLGGAIGDFGRDSAGDATYLNARPSADPADVAAEVAAGLPQPAGGRKEYKDDDGKVTKVVEWFGYKLHLLVDVKHEVALAYQITAPGVGDNEVIPTLLAQAQGNLPAQRIKTLAYDKAADDSKVHECLHDASVKPLIQHCRHWPKDGEQEKTLGGRIPLHVVHDEAGTIFCYDTVSDPPVRRAMAYIGHEKGRGTLKYRCPARHEGFTCASDEKCNAGKSYGMTVRVPQALDLRRFPPIPRATKQFERLYKGRTSVERVNARFKVFWGIDDGNIRGAYRFSAHVGAVLAAHAALATLLASAPRWEGGPLGQMRLSPIARALREHAAAKAAPSGAA